MKSSLPGDGGHPEALTRCPAEARRTAGTEIWPPVSPGREHSSKTPNVCQIRGLPLRLKFRDKQRSLLHTKSGCPAGASRWTQGQGNPGLLRSLQSSGSLACEPQLIFKARHFGGSSFRCQSSKPGSPMWVMSCLLLREKLWVLHYLLIVGSCAI